jgi:hypothetical protein
MKSWAESLREIALKLPEGDPDRLFYVWLTDNPDGLREAAAGLGVDIPEGIGFIDRLQAAVTPILVERYRKG